MWLKHIELQGFKSFPDKTVIRFGDGITAIVGPNGSGKSNIADAVRWVMGETSSKQLRGAKMEDVVFDGTALRKPLGFAEVSLVLDNSDKTLPLEFEEVALTRRYYRSGESEYFINHTAARLRDIQDLLRDTGLGKTGYSIIGQGAITEIIAAKSSDRRAIFEEAAGIAKFRYKKEESERRLERTQENLVRLCDILSELSDRLPELEKQAEKARKYLALREQRKGLELTLWTDALSQLDENLEKTKKSLAAFNEDILRLDGELEKNEARTLEVAAVQERLTAEIEDLRRAKESLDALSAQRSADILVKQNDIQHAKKDIEKILQLITDAKASAKKSEELIAESNAKIQALTEKTALIDAERQTLSTSLASAENMHSSAFEELHKTQEELSVLRDRQTYLAVREAQLDSEADSNHQLIEGRKKEIEDAKERLEGLKTAGEQAMKNIAELTERLNENQNIKNGYSVKTAGRQNSLNSVVATLSRLSNTYSEKSNRLQILRGMEKHYDGFAQSVRIIMDEAKKGVLQGVEGTVADLIKVEPEYTTAVETALGGALQNVVTTDEKSGKSCISFLKNRGAGRATFLPLDTISRGCLDVRAVKSEAGFVGLASELAECDEKYKPVTAFLLGRTVVASDMDSATQIARKNRYGFRIVTLDGQIVNVGGSLTGGSAAKGFGVLSRKTEIDELALLCTELEKQLSSEQQKQKELTDEISQLSALSGGVDAEIRDCEQQLIKENGEAQHLKTYMANIAEQQAAISREIEGFGQSEKKRIEEKAVIETQRMQNENTVAELEQKASEQQKAIDGFTASVAEINEKIHKCDLERLEAEKDLEAAKASKQELLTAESMSEKTVEGYKDEILKTENTITDIENAIKLAESQNAETASHIEKNTAETQAKTAERMLCEKDTTKLREEERTMFSAKEKTVREAEKCSLILDNASTERDTILTKIWDEYELTLSEAQEQRIEIQSREEAQRRVSHIKGEMKALGDVNVAAVDEYASVKQRADELSAQTEDLQKAKKQLEDIISELVLQMAQTFKERFKVINEEFSKSFQQLFDGGTAKLELDDPTDVLNSGVEIYVAPPGKIIKSLTALSGGEQALTAIALYFALLTIRPAPFCLLDEIEAALDDVNVVRYAQYLSHHDKTQFIVITHRRGTMEAANMLYGVTMREKGISKILAIDVSEIEKHI